MIFIIIYDYNTAQYSLTGKIQPSNYLRFLESRLFIISHEKTLEDPQKSNQLTSFFDVNATLQSRYRIFSCIILFIYFLSFFLSVFSTLFLLFLSFFFLFILLFLLPCYPFFSFLHSPLSICIDVTLYLIAPLCNLWTRTFKS